MAWRYAKPTLPTSATKNEPSSPRISRSWPKFRCSAILGRMLPIGLPQYSSYGTVFRLRLYIVIRSLQDLPNDWQLYITKPPDINTIPSTSMFP